MVDFKALLIPDGSFIETRWGERGFVDHKARKHHDHICYRPIKRKSARQHVRHGWYVVLVRGDEGILR